MRLPRLHLQAQGAPHVMVSRSTLQAIERRIRALGVEASPVLAFGDFAGARRAVQRLAAAGSTAEKLERQEVVIALDMAEHATRRCSTPARAREAENQARVVMGLYPLPRPWVRWSPRTALLDPVRWRLDGEAGRIIEITDELFDPRIGSHIADEMLVDRVVEHALGCPDDLFVLSTDHVAQLIAWCASSSLRERLLSRAENLFVGRRVRTSAHAAEAPILHGVEALRGRHVLWIEPEAAPLGLSNLLRFAPSELCFPHGAHRCSVCQRVLARDWRRASSLESSELVDKASLRAECNEAIRFSWAVVRSNGATPPFVLRTIALDLEAGQVPTEFLGTVPQGFERAQRPASVE